MQRTMILAAIAAALVFPVQPLTAAPKRAGAASMSSQDGALVGLHELRREGGRVCMVDHTHVGSSTGQSSRKAAEVVAQREWSSFTGWEYGAGWGNPSIAGSRTFRCSGSGSSYACEFEARPCRRG